MVTAKEEVRHLLDSLPDSATFEEIQYHIYVRQRVERGLMDVEEGRMLTLAEVEEQMSKWLGEQDGLCRELSSDLPDRSGKRSTFSR